VIYKLNLLIRLFYFESNLTHCIVIEKTKVYVNLNLQVLNGLQSKDLQIWPIYLNWMWICNEKIRDHFFSLFCALLSECIFSLTVSFFNLHFYNLSFCFHWNAKHVYANFFYLSFCNLAPDKFLIVNGLDAIFVIIDFQGRGVEPFR